MLDALIHNQASNCIPTEHFNIVFPNSLPFCEGLAVSVYSSKGGLIELPAYRPEVTCMKVFITHALSNSSTIEVVGTTTMSIGLDFCHEGHFLALL